MNYIYFDHRGNAYIAISLLMLSCYVIVHLARRQSTSIGARWLLFFFVCLSLNNVAFFLNNALPYWGTLFQPLQDAFAICGGIGMVRFAYAYPDGKALREARVPTILMVIFSLIAFGYSLYWSINLLATPRIALAPDGYYLLLLPLVILFAAGVFLYRAVQLDNRPQSTDNGLLAKFRRTLAALVVSKGRNANAQRMFAAALLTGILPAIGSVGYGPK